jgi:uncharacterized protein (TIGR02001 family)
MLGSYRAARGLLVGAAAMTCVAAAPGAAEEAREFEWSTTMTGTSDYIFRGLSLNNEDPTYQQSIDASYGIFYAGVWGSQVADDYEPVELDFYVGFKPVVGPVTFDLGVVYYAYFWADDPGSLDYWELKLGAEFSPITNLTLKPVFWYVPDQSNSDAVYTIEGTAAYEFHAVGIFTPTISGLVGYTEADSDGTFFGDAVPTDDYTYWNAGLALSVEKFTFDFRYWDTNIQDDGLADERFVFTASITLP